MFSIATGTTPDAVTTKGTAVPPRTRYAVVGAGWRASVFLRMAYLMPDRFEVTGVVTRRAEVGAELEAQWGVPTHRDVESMLAADRPDFVVLSVPWPVTPELTRQLVAAGVPVLAETPPAPDADGMRALWADVGASGLVQVAEQYALMPLHAARLEIVRSGLIGVPGSVLVSSTHNYHAVALMRRFLDVGRGPVTVRAQTFTADLVDPITPTGWTHETAAKPARTVLASVDFGEGRMGRYDFTDNQWWNPLRPDHLVVRGSAGEIWDETVVRMVDDVTPMTSRIERASTGVGMNYEGLDLTHLSLDGRVVFRNGFEGARLSDDDIGVAALLTQTGAWVREEAEPPYPLAEACHDHLVGLAIDEALGSGESVRVEADVWS